MLIAARPVGYNRYPVANPGNNIPGPGASNNGLSMAKRKALAGSYHMPGLFSLPVS